MKYIQRSVQPGTIEEWSKRVVKTAKQLCNDPDCKRIQIITTGKGDISYSFAPNDREAIDCVIRSIRTSLPSMSSVQQRIFRRKIVEFQKMKSKDMTRKSH